MMLSLFTMKMFLFKQIIFTFALCVDWCRLQAAAAAKLDKVRRQTAATLQSTLRQHTTTDISICLEPTCIIVPDHGIYTPYECDFFVQPLCYSECFFDYCSVAFIIIFLISFLFNAFSILLYFMCYIKLAACLWVFHCKSFIVLYYIISYIMPGF